MLEFKYYACYCAGQNSPPFPTPSFQPQTFLALLLQENEYLIHYKIGFNGAIVINAAFYMNVVQFNFSSLHDCLSIILLHQELFGYNKNLPRCTLKLRKKAELSELLNSVKSILNSFPFGLSV